ncbi:NADP-dependent oxidoreductase domain-containing protein [Rhexocercosporidium sp. MPI-PUGE-AT-0058]|nr:NADP-dependent oxidoreductase domain-containing protein [Rhexocercosporidium sp. MPI-PUGE-AT-0058]
MATSHNTTVPIVFGAMTFGTKGVEATCVHTLEECSMILDVFQKHGHLEIDTALIYGEGSSEQYLGQLNWQDRGFIIETKFSPKLKASRHGLAPDVKVTHGPEHLRIALRKSLESLKTEKIDMWYLHAPERSTPFETTLRKINNLYMAQMCEICDQNGWIKPAVYQGLYNAFHRAIEPELIPYLRYYGIALYAFNPLAGGYLTSRYVRNMLTEDTGIGEGSRFDPKRKQAQNYRLRSFNNKYFDALDILRDVAKKHSLPEAECALRWISHHSLLNRSHGDVIIIGASSAAQLEGNLTNLEKGPLPEDVVEALEEGWKTVRGVCMTYWH